MGSVRPPRGKNGKWQARWRDEFGEEKTQGGFTSEKLAKIFVQEVELAKLKGKSKRADITQMTLFDFVYGHWQRTLTVLPDTIASYDNALRKYIMPEFGNTVLTEISTMDVEIWRSSMLNGKTFVTKPLAEKTVERIVNVMATIMRKAEANSFIDESPFKNFKRPKAKSRKKAMHLEFEQYLAFESRFPAQNRIIIQVMYHTGLRPSEALGLTWDRINLDAMEIVVDRQLLRNPVDSLFGRPKTLASNRTVSFGAELKGLLMKHKETFGVGPNGLLARNRAESVYTYKAASQMFNKIARELNLPVGSGLHMFRHTYASNAIAAGVNIKHLQEQLGHQSITETLDTYGHLLVESKKDYVAKLDEAYRAKLKATKTELLKVAE